MKQTTKGTLPGGKTAGGGSELMRAKIDLVGVCERGEPGALGHILATYPAHVPELIEFYAALRACEGYEHEALTAQSAAVGARAQQRAMAAVFGDETPLAAPIAVSAPRAAVAVAQGMAQGVVATLRGLRKARKLTPRALADRVGLGVDVLTHLEHREIRAASVPERLVKALADALGTTVDQMSAAISAQPAIVPALRRARSGATKDVPVQEEMDFTEAVRTSPNMSDEQKARWLDE